MTIEYKGMEATPGSVAMQQAKQQGLRFTSGFRTKEEEMKLGGSTKSMHLSGKAYDFAGSKSAMKSFSSWAKASGLFTEVLYETDGHYDHVHVGWATGKHPDGKTYVGDHTLIDKKPGKVSDSAHSLPGVTGGSFTENIFSNTVRVVLIGLCLVVGVVFFLKAFPIDKALPLPPQAKMLKKIVKGVK